MRDAALRGGVEEDINNNGGDMRKNYYTRYDYRDHLISVEIIQESSCERYRIKVEGPALNVVTDTYSLTHLEPWIEKGIDSAIKNKQEKEQNHAI